MRRDPRSFWARVAVVLATTATLALLPALPAAAHDYLVSSDPSYNSIVSTPIHSVSLTFDEGVLNFGRGSDGIFVTGPGANSRHFETSCAHVSGDAISASVTLGGPGKYAISWRIVSADGHPVSDTITFTYRPPAGTTSARGTLAGPNCGVTIDQGARFGAPGDTANTSLVALVVGISAGVVILITGVLIATVVILRRAAAHSKVSSEAPGDDAGGQERAATK